MFTDNIYHHSIWRQEVDMRLKNLSQWLEERDLLTPDVRSQLERIQLQNRSDRSWWLLWPNFRAANPN